ncbi:MAG: hypothetical protein CFH30_00208 [Alphaproteobacteria bacterium MarineAlpha8_Bin1]|nr:MAG: hypothetical protein CFH30_00208 [Alphaproteobacteria bacterium MarineAlpha8_Bin1]|tara:strand:+ start:1131 stop:1400 length:270 start_codon:yes stop_codon:yes gene_type:complete
MNSDLSELVALLKKISDEKQVEKIAAFEKKINDISISILENKETLRNTENISSQLEELNQIIMKMSHNQKKNLKVFEDFKSFIEKRKIK